MGDVVVRLARPEEVALAGEIAVRAYLTDGLIAEDDEYVEHLRDAEGRADGAELLVAVDDEGLLLGSVTVAGFGTPYAQIARDGELEFRMLVAAPSARGRGVGELLARAVLDRARELGCARVVLCVVDFNAKAIRLYERLGFQRLPDRDWSPVPGIRLHGFGCDL